MYSWPVLAVIWGCCLAIFLVWGTAEVARNKHRDTLGWGLAACVFGPFALLVVGFLPAVPGRMASRGADDVRVGRPPIPPGVPCAPGNGSTASVPELVARIAATAPWASGPGRASTRQRLDALLADGALSAEQHERAVWLMGTVEWGSLRKGVVPSHYLD